MARISSLLIVLLADDLCWSTCYSVDAWSSDRRRFLQKPASAFPALLGACVIRFTPLNHQGAALAAEVTASTASHQHPFRYNDEWTGTALPVLSLDEALKKVITPQNQLQPEVDQLSLVTATASYWPMGQWPDPILRRPADPVNLDEWRDRTSELQRAGEILRQTARIHGAVGLAAQQCGINARIVYLELHGNRNNNDASLIMINPQIVARSLETEMRVWREECLVLPPTFRATVLRDDWVDVAYNECRDSDGTGVPQLHVVVRRLRGETARALQHELDHDRGILVTDHVGLDELENDLMRAFEKPGHAERMVRAYERYVSSMTSP